VELRKVSDLLLTIQFSTVIHMATMTQKKTTTTNSTPSTCWADRVKVSNSTTRAKITSFPRKEVDSNWKYRIIPLMRVSQNETAVWWDFSRVIGFFPIMRPIILRYGYGRIVALRVS